MGKVTYITEEGLRKMKEDYDRMTKIERPAISKMIGEAIEKGDISENAEYDAAKDAQGMLEAKIALLSEKIASARIIDESKIDISSVQIMNKVTIRNKTNDSTMQYTIVSEHEADLKLGKISIQTPIAKGLMGKKLGDVVEIQVPSGKMQFEIIDIAI
ncbi:MAG: transcription elongation factor GreA [Bacteroidota bacterium]|nr:transcription elongation factor GreA [Odoribacter sp.]MDP3642674.1 transcription elongation factor GreA [Bacteroidota bacterium]